MFVVIFISIALGLAIGSYNSDKKSYLVCEYPFELTKQNTCEHDGETVAPVKVRVE